MVTECFFLVVAIYVLVVTALAVYGLNFFYLTVTAMRFRGIEVDSWLPDPLPSVTVQLPIFNEPFVVKRVIDATACLDWPHDRLEIQVLDDSTDATPDLAASAVAYWQTVGVNIKHIRRPHREGYKAGALSFGLTQATGEFIAILDADFVPFPDFLNQTMGFFANPQIGFVQARWVHLNRNTSLLTYLQSLGIDGHFMVEQLVRANKGYIMSFNGAAGVWRRTAIIDAGGWGFGSLTEDLDLSYRAALRGWKSAYLPNVAIPCELVPSISAYRKQQTRWAQGSAECVRRLLPSIIRSHFRVPVKIQAILHLTGYFIQVLMLITSLLSPLIVVVPISEGWRTLLSWIGIVLLPVAIAPIFLVLTAQRFLHPHSWWREILLMPLLWLFGTGMTLNNSWAVWQGLRAQPTVFERTPKWGLISDQSYTGILPYRPSRNWLVKMELILVGWNASTAVLAWSFFNFGVFIYSLLFATGLAIVSVSTIWEVHRARI